MGALPFIQISLTALKTKSSEYPKELKTLGDHMRNRRLDLKLLQKDVGQRIGVSVSSVWNWENGWVAPAVKYLPAIIAFLGYNPLPKPKTFAGRLVLYRKAKGWTQKVFAKSLGVDQTTLARWERGERKPIGKYQDLVASVWLDIHKK
jgi:transcriptional regulator with XRE-family HTH domain